MYHEWTLNEGVTKMRMRTFFALLPAVIFLAAPMRAQEAPVDLNDPARAAEDRAHVASSRRHASRASRAGRGVNPAICRICRHR
jgi:hypothetical protein